MKQTLKKIGLIGGGVLVLLLFFGLLGNRALGMLAPPEPTPKELLTLLMSYPNANDLQNLSHANPAYINEQITFRTNDSRQQVLEYYANRLQKFGFDTHDTLDSSIDRQTIGFLAPICPFQIIDFTLTNNGLIEISYRSQGCI
jgi:hypothetical protein